MKSGYAETQESFFIYDVALINFEDQPFRIGYEARVNPICLPINLILNWEKQDYTFTGSLSLILATRNLHHSTT